MLHGVNMIIRPSLDSSPVSASASSSSQAPDGTGSSSDDSSSSQALDSTGSSSDDSSSSQALDSTGSSSDDSSSSQALDSTGSSSDDSSSSQALDSTGSSSDDSSSSQALDSTGSPSTVSSSSQALDSTSSPSTVSSSSEPPDSTSSPSTVSSSSEPPDSTSSPSTVSSSSEPPDSTSSPPTVSSSSCDRNCLDKEGRPDLEYTKCCVNIVDDILAKGAQHSTINTIKKLERLLEATNVTETKSMNVGRMVVMLYKPEDTFNGLRISASETQATSKGEAASSKVSVQLPKELQATTDNTIVFCMITWPETNEDIWGKQNVSESRLVGLSVRGKTVSGLQQRVNITWNLTINENQQPSCVFFNFSSSNFSDHGCLTLWKSGQSQVTCSCDHLTYFAVLMVSPTVSPTDQMALSYITLIGCTLSLCALVITVLLFITKRSARSDITMKIHINLVISLILLNLHFLPNHQVAALSPSGFCTYMAILLHYSLLATFMWMLLEGFHLYLLLVRVFNIYVKKYLLKLCLVGWGIPVVIVILVVIIDKDTYGPVALHSSDTNSTGSKICYISSTVVKMVTTVGVFSLVFVFNLIMLVVTIRRLFAHHHGQEVGQQEKGRGKRNACTVLGITCLLGITWGLIFFSFGALTTAGMYIFCILNSLQGVFIFLWLFLVMWKNDTASNKTGSETRSTN